MNQTYEIYALYDRLEIKFLQKIKFWIQWPVSQKTEGQNP